MTSAREAAAERLTDLAAAQNTDLHDARLGGGRISSFGAGSSAWPASSRIYRAHEVGTVHGGCSAGRAGPDAPEAGPPRREGSSRGRSGLARSRDAADQVG